MSRSDRAGTPRASQVLLVFLILILAALAPPAAGLWVHHEIQHRMKFRIEGKVVPDFFRSSYSIENARFLWERRVSLRSGRLKVAYDLGTYLRSGILRVRLSSPDLHLELLGSWAKLQGASDVRAAKFEADLGIGREGLEEIFFIEIESPAFQFRIRNSDNKKARASAAGEGRDPQRTLP